MKSPKKQGPTAEETALREVSSQQWNDYVERFQPAEAALIKKAEFTAGEKAQVKGEVAGDVAAAFKGATRNTVSSHGAGGADVSSGKTKLSLAADASAAGTAKGVGQGIAVAGGQVDSDQMKLKIAGIGRGVAHAATADLSREARGATRLALAASQARFEKNQAIVEGVATVAGAATKKFQLHNEGKKDAKKFSDEFGDFDVSLPDIGFGDRSTPINFGPNPFVGGP